MGQIAQGKEQRFPPGIFTPLNQVYVYFSGKIHNQISKAFCFHVLQISKAFCFHVLQISKAISSLLNNVEF